ncbi:MAG: nucleotidyltransferase family protein [Candidatus Acidiferrales bacterium]
MSSAHKPYPVLLAAGPSSRLGSPKSPELFHGKNAVEIAIENCAGLSTPVVVLGYQATSFARRVPRGAKIVVNKKWRAGQLGSLLAGLRHIPSYATFLLYPVDHIFLKPEVIRRLLRAFERRKQYQQIFMPRFQGRPGHPVIFCAQVRRELELAETARDVVYRNPGRVCYVPVRTPAIWKGFDPRGGSLRSKSAGGSARV